jgi:hypothetical protein
MASAAEYGPPSATIATPSGPVEIWLVRDTGVVLVAMRAPDRTPAWQDDFVVSLDLGGRPHSPGQDDFQWYLRRVLDSSVVLRGGDGRWRPPQDDPDWRLGGERAGGGWELRSQSESAGWSVELRLDQAYFEREPAIAFRVFNNDPQGWFVWPLVGDLRQPTELEQRPDHWIRVVLR